jgi:hypothetical protein
VGARARVYCTAEAEELAYQWTQGGEGGGDNTETELNA